MNAPTKGKVTAVVQQSETTIHQKEGTIQETRKGVFRGFGAGLKDYVMKGGKTQDLAVTVNTGSYGAGHKNEGKWAVQIMVDVFDNQEDANVVADRLAAQIKQLLNPPMGSLPMPLGETRQ